MKRALKITAGVVVLLVAALLLALNTIALRVARSQLTAALNAPASLDGLSLSLFSGRAELRGLKIGQPPGFGGDDAVSVGLASADIDVAALLKGEVRIESVKLEDPRIHAVKDPGKGLNFASLAKPSQETTPPEKEAGKPVSLLLAALRLDRGVVRFTDHTKGVNAVDVVVTNLTVALDGIQAGPALSGAPAEGAARVDFAIVQAAGTNATGRILARIAPLRPGAEPSVAAVFRLAGFELTTAGPLPGKDIIGFLGGYGLDLNADVLIAPGLLDVKGGMVNEYGQSHDLVRVTGTLADPKPEMASAIAGVLNMPVAALSAVAGNVVKTGEQAAGAVIHTGEAVVNGTLSTVNSLASGLFSSGEKLVKGDLSGAGGELVKGVEDTASSAAGTVTGAGSAAVGGLVAAAGTAVGGEQMAKWRAESPARSAALFSEAEKKLAGQAFPPAKP